VSTANPKRQNDGGISSAGESTLLSIIIVSYMSAHHVRPCLDSILSQRNVRYEIIVVDNASTDGSADIVEQYFPSVFLIRSEKNLGFAEGNNLALQHCRGNYVLLLNPDTVLTESCLEKLVAFMENSPDVGAAGCKILYPDGKIQISCGYFPTVASALWGGEAITMLFRKFNLKHNFFGSCGITPEHLDKSRDVDTLLGACAILRRNVIDEVGFFDANMFLYFEECDLFYRIKRSGARIAYTPDATVYHHAGGSVVHTATAVRHYLKSQEYYLGKNFGLKRISAFRTGLMVSSLLKVIFLFAVSPFMKERSKVGMRKKIAWHWNTFVCELSMVLRIGNPIREKVPEPSREEA
jgi:GT2 family glycosyltransferase